jgi:DNA-binding response OmpR family regulator
VDTDAWAASTQRWRVLVADRDRSVHHELEVMLRGFGHETRSLFHGADVPAVLRGRRHQILLLATALKSGPSGYSVCRQLRAAGDRTPIIMLGAMSEEAEVVAALEAGADAVAGKPLRLAELRSRISALLRRERYQCSTAPVRLGHVLVDPSARQVTRDGELVALTYTEYEILFALLSGPDRVFSREQLLRASRGGDCSTAPRSIDVYIRQLRLKLERDPSRPTLIQTVRGVGYKATRPVMALGMCPAGRAS